MFKSSNVKLLTKYWVPPCLVSYVVITLCDKSCFPEDYVQVLPCKSVITIRRNPNRCNRHLYSTGQLPGVRGERRPCVAHRSWSPWGTLPPKMAMDLLVNSSGFYCFSPLYQSVNMHVFGLICVRFSPGITPVCLLPHIGMLSPSASAF